MFDGINGEDFEEMTMYDANESIRPNEKVVTISLILILKLRYFATLTLLILQFNKLYR